MLTGSLGMLPSASLEINANGKLKAIEPAWFAQTYVVRIANPIACILVFNGFKIYF